jgi:predicted Zn finger-like uncharacterized protein
MLDKISYNVSMLLQCPSCNSRFLVNDALIPPKGREVRCGKCKHNWFFTPVPTSDAQSSQESPAFATFDHALASATPEQASIMAESAGGTAQLPAIARAPFSLKRSLLPTAALVIITIITALASHYPEWKTLPVIGGIYRMSGVTDTTGLAFSDMKVTREVTETKTRFIVAGNIINRLDAATVQLPEVRVSLIDSQGKILLSRNYQVNKTMQANDIYPFRVTNVETSFADKVAQVVVDLGNSYELMVR